MLLPSESRRFFHVHLPVAETVVADTYDFAHALRASAKCLVAQETAYILRRFVDSDFEIYQAVSGMEECRTIKTLVTGKVRWAGAEHGGGG